MKAALKTICKDYTLKGELGGRYESDGTFFIYSAERLQGA